MTQWEVPKSVLKEELYKVRELFPEKWQRYDCNAVSLDSELGFLSMKSAAQGCSSGEGMNLMSFALSQLGKSGSDLTEGWREFRRKGAC